jgi:AGZA family xanthine/uracil permease-like MFS transporter
LGALTSLPVLLTLFGLVVTGTLISLKFRAAILIAMLASALVGIGTGLIEFKGLVSAPPSLAPTFFQLDITGNWLKSSFWTAIFNFLFLDMFDSVDTLCGVGERAGLIKNGVLPKAREALTADALAAAGGAVMGTSTITSYIESAAGVSAGARTGPANIFTALFFIALFFIAAFFFNPWIETIRGGSAVDAKKVLYPVIAPALIILGAFIVPGLNKTDWDDPTEYLPAFLCAIIMPFTFSISEGISFGFIPYSFFKVATGRGGEPNPLVHIISLLFILRCAFLAV